MIKADYENRTIKVSIIILLMLAPFTGVFSQPEVPDYSMTERKDIPVEYTWKTEDIYLTYQDWEKDKQLVKSEISQIDSYSKDWCSAANKMYDCLKRLNEISLRLDKLSTYAVRRQHVELGNSLYRKMEGEIQALYVLLDTKTSFIESDVLKLGQERFNKFLSEEKGLDTYKFGITKTLRRKDHILPADKEDIVSLSRLFSGSSEQAANLLNNLEIPPAEVVTSEGKKVSLNYANYMLLRASKNPQDRSLAMNTFWNNHRKFENTLAVLLDAEMKRQFFEAKTHNFSTSLQAALYRNNIDTAVYYQLINSVNSNLAPLHKYLSLKKELLGLDKFRYDDIYVSAVKAVDKTYSFDEAKKIIFETLKPLGQEYLTVLQKPFSERWIDIYPNQGKESGAYSGGLYGVHPYIKLNYNGKYDAVSTLIHELGHAMHSYFSNTNQAYENAGYPIFTAEVASTFNENMLINYLLKNEKDDLFKLYLLDSYIDGARATIYRQTLFAEFELAMHKKVEAGESLTPDWLNKNYLELTRKYYGHDKGITQVDDYIQNEWSNIPHFYMNYYVFQYSTGILGSMALSSFVLNGGEKERDKYLTLLKSGGSDFPIELIKKAGLDMSKKEAMDSGLKNFSRLVDEMEKLVMKLKQEKKL
ncbi:MAG: oligoendopeptidase F [Methanococcaceae archaeon]